MKTKAEFSRQPNQNIVLKHRLGDMEFEVIHQTVPGDCVLITYLNTVSLVTDNKIMATPREVRDRVVQMRWEHHEGDTDILNDNQPLNYNDTIRLFQTIYGIDPRQEDIVFVNGQIDRETLRNNIEHGILELLDTYESGLCATGLGEHCRSIWKLGRDMYVVIDPQNVNGFEQMSKTQLIDFLTNLCTAQEPAENFFYFLRTKSESRN